jgi:hypothetical protein
VKANKKKMLLASNAGARQRGSKASAIAKADAGARARKKRAAAPMVTAAPPTDKSELPRSGDAWNPSSFGDRR